MKWGGRSNKEEFYHPKHDSGSLIDRGVEVGLPFKGIAPDIGFIEKK